MRLQILSFFILIVASIAVSSCSSAVFVADTSSDTIYEYQDDYYVRTVDSTMEMHYNLWSNRAAIWLSAINLTDDILFVISDSCYVTYDNERFYYDLTYENEEYVRQVTAIPDLEDYQIGEFYPVVPKGWKGFMGPPMPFNLSDFEHIDGSTTFTKDNSPILMTSQVCFYRKSGAYSPSCVRDTIWVESVMHGDGSLLHSLNNDSSYKKADKFFISNSYGYDY